MLSEQRDSVGPSFEAAPTVTDDFTKIIIEDSDRSNVEQLLGITNHGNHCYRNAVLTASLSPASVMRYLIHWHSQTSQDENKNPPESVVTVLSRISSELSGVNRAQDAVDRQVDFFWTRFCYPQGTSPLLLPVSWRDRLGDTDNSQENEQHDAHEFLMWMMTAVRNCLQGHAGPNGSSKAPPERYDWVFESRFVVRTICERCQSHVRRRKHEVESNPCLVLNMPQNPEGLHLADLIDKAMHTKLPDLICSRCKKTGGCTQDQKFQHAPALLTLMISRSYQCTRGRQLRKNLSAVTIPEKLDISRHLNIHEFGEGSSVTYSLSSVVAHRGTRLGRGHYISYIRAGEGRNEWTKVDDATVTRADVADFDETRVADFSTGEFANRFTPYILMYERNFGTDTITAGRTVTNVGEGENEDEQPSQRRQTMPDVTEGADEDINLPPAVLTVTITIGDVEIELPRHVISHFDWNKPREIKIDAKLRVPRGEIKRALREPNETHYMEASLSSIVEQRDREKSIHRVRKSKKWNKYWRDVGRSSDDLTRGEIKGVVNMVKLEKSKK